MLARATKGTEEPEGNESIALLLEPSTTDGKTLKPAGGVHRGMRWMVLGMACLVALSGCLMASAQTESAMSLEEDARDRADEKLQDPDLVGLWGIETPYEVTSNESELKVYLDETPGDGEAASWAYAFLGQERGGIVVVADEIGVVAEYWEDIDVEEEDRPESLAWQLDSEAAAALLAENDSWPAMTDAHALSWELEHEDNTTVWDVHTQEISFDEETRSYHAVVDAETAEILAIDEGSTSSETPPGGVEEDTESASYERGCNQQDASGTVTPVDDVATDPVDLEHPGMLALTVSYNGAGPLEIEVLDDDGQTVFEDSTTMVGSGSYDETIQGVGEGEYTLTASTGSGSGTASSEITAVWGGGFDQCEQTYGPTSEAGPDTEIPAWTHVDRGLGVPTLGLR